MTAEPLSSEPAPTGLPYTQLVVRLLEHFADVEGKYADMVIPVWRNDLAERLGASDEGITGRRVHLAFEELRECGLVSAERISGTGNMVQFFRPDITGAGLRFIEALRLQAKVEGKQESWFWSGVEKAANLGQLVGLVMQAAARMFE